MKANAAAPGDQRNIARGSRELRDLHRLDRSSCEPGQSYRRSGKSIFHEFPPVKAATPSTTLVQAPEPVFGKFGLPSTFELRSSIPLVRTTSRFARVSLSNKAWSILIVRTWKRPLIANLRRPVPTFGLEAVDVDVAGLPLVCAFAAGLLIHCRLTLSSGLAGR